MTVFLRTHCASSTARKWAGITILTLLFYTLTSTLSLSKFSFKYPSSRPPRPRPPLGGTCSPKEYANGSWSYHPRTNASVMTHPRESLAFSGFENCASSREYFWHLGADDETQYDRFPGAQSWEWIPGGGCEGMRALSKESLVRNLVENGGWYLVGDSVTENHFFSLSCVLYPHVIATPDYTENANFDRGWAQHLYLSPSSPLRGTLALPKGFNISFTPLVTFRRVDLLFSKDELVDIHKAIQPANNLKAPKDQTLFSEEPVWTLPVSQYLSEFLAPLPMDNYATMVVSTGGHWTTTLFSGVSPEGIKGVLSLFEHAMQRWAERVQEELTSQQRTKFGGTTATTTTTTSSTDRGRPRRRVLVRAYLPGHESCHGFRKPWKEVQPFVWNWFNWGDIWAFNAVFEKLLSTRRFPDIHYLGIDRPARLRPDAHTTGDCLHIMAGAGVLEGWTHYIWHFVTQYADVNGY
ncbi:hypothetical protein M413DRAFT_66173 [Hebeloma cylindrosporum]|uniref:Uncharacterized protein n=1 Tax=Hebeloma cylindrosporum TaxID=76867 RepID=A0A0C2Y727_HEBCY|nr:hypothetical protein M413DRAFT_66173 [Hebeloma cylindrosporum h7]